MIRLSAFLHRLSKDDRGVYITEFALVMPILFMLIMGGLEFGIQSYMRSVVNGQMEMMSRSVTMQNASITTLESTFTTAVNRVIPSATAAITKSMMKDFSGIETPEKITRDTNSNGIIDVGDCFIDIDGDQVRDLTSMKDGDIGGGDDIVLYKATITYARPMALVAWMPGVGSTASVESKVLVRRQPFENQAVVAPWCRTV